MPSMLSGAAGDLGLGDMLQSQQTTETEEEKRRRRLGLSPLSPGGAAQQLGFGRTGVGGVAPMTGLGVMGGRY